MLLGREKTASGHLLHEAHACLVLANYATTNIFRQLEEKQKTARRTSSCDYRHLMLLLTFILSNLFRKEVDERNSHQRGVPVIDPSEELISVTNVFLRRICDGTSCSVKLLQPRVPRHPPILAFCNPSLTGILQLYALYTFHILYTLFTLWLSFT
jgi:hypothetical protein